MAEAAKKTSKSKSNWARAAKGGEGKACGVANCKRPYRAKGYCFFHYKKWRQGDLPHSRYHVCSKAECRKKAFKAGLCEVHFGEVYKKSAATAEAAAS